MKPDLQKILAYWLDVLRLGGSGGWTIQIGYEANLATPEGSPAYGLCWPLPDNKTATIQIRDPESSTDGVVFTPAMVEGKVVHEILHCPMSELGLREQAAILKEEQIVWPMAEALVRLRGTAGGAMLARAARVALCGQKVLAPRAATAGGARRKTMDPIMVMIAALRGVLAGSDPAGAVEQARALLDEFGKMGGAEGSGDEAPPAAAADQNGPPGPGMPARAADCPSDKAARATPPRGAVVRPLTITDVQQALREDRERGSLLSAARTSRVGLTDKLEAHLVTRPLAEVRQVLDTLDVKPAETNPVVRASLADAVGGSAAAEEVSIDDQLAIRHLDHTFAGIVPMPTRSSIGAAQPRSAAVSVPPAERKPGSWSLKDLEALRTAGKAQQKAGV